MKLKFEQADTQFTLPNCTEAKISGASSRTSLQPDSSVLTPKKIQLLMCDNMVENIEIDMLRETMNCEAIRISTR